MVVDTERLIDTYFARFMADKSGLVAEEKNQFFSVMQDLSLSLDLGHSCLLVDNNQKNLITKSPLVSSQQDTPLVLLENLLYFQRYYLYESRLASQLVALGETTKNNKFDVDHVLDQVFGEEHSETNWHRLGGLVALDKHLCIISGGPGTGKTTTVVKILACLLMAMVKPEVSIALAAPTGKAAMRLKESISASCGEDLTLSQEIVSQIPDTAQTIHRLLGSTSSGNTFYHNSENPLDYDIVVIDEASMVDLALMSKLVDALGSSTTLILLGDKDQLASVESGSVLADCIVSLPANTTVLQKSYRFNQDIKQLAGAVIDGDGDGSWSLLEDPEIESISLLKSGLDEMIGEYYFSYHQIIRETRGVDYNRYFALLNEFKVLCALRRGLNGVEGINRRVERYLEQNGIHAPSGEWYEGRPIIILQNDYSLQLFNGDIGICLKDPEDGVLKVWFESGDGDYRSILTFRLPLCNTVYGMTVHKSQGSEFTTVVLVIPREDNRVLNRELIYTGITRARKQVVIAGSKEIFISSLNRRVQRNSGLAKLIKLKKSN